MKLEPNVWFDEVVKTYHLISPHIHHTQLVTCPDLNEELMADSSSSLSLYKLQALLKLGVRFLLSQDSQKMN